MPKYFSGVITLIAQLIIIPEAWSSQNVFDEPLNDDNRFGKPKSFLKYEEDRAKGTIIIAMGALPLFAGLYCRFPPAIGLGAINFMGNLGFYYLAFNRDNKYIHKKLTKN